MALRYYLYGKNEENQIELIKEWLRRFEMMNGIENERVDFKGKKYVCRMDYSEYKRKLRGGYTHKYVALYMNIDEINLMKRDLEDEIDEMTYKNPNMIIIITGRYVMYKYPYWLNRIYQKYSFSEVNSDLSMNQVISFLLVENIIPEFEIPRFKFYGNPIIQTKLLFDSKNKYIQ